MRAYEVGEPTPDSDGVARVERERPEPAVDEAREAYRYVDRGEHQGKVVVRVG